MHTNVAGAPDRLTAVFALLETSQPDPEQYDVVWHGPYYIPRAGEWCRSSFMLYRGTLYVSLFVERTWQTISWKLGADRVETDRGFRTSLLDDRTWQDALAQIEHRLGAAVANPVAYNRRVERLLPPAARTGKIRRGLTWPLDAEPPLPAQELRRLALAVERGGGHPRLETMTVSAYLRVVSLAYDAVFDELRALSPREKYRRKADGRHGGMLDLSPDDSAAFSDWLRGGNWAGAHPWEIVFGHPHGILLGPHHDADEGWSYWLSVDSLGWYGSAARMAIALAEQEVPFDLYRWEQVSDALSGLDYVGIGTDALSLTYEELSATRPDSVERIRWDPVPRIEPISPDQQERVARASASDEPHA